MGKNTPKAEIISQTRAIVEQYTTKLTLRQLYYRLVASEVIENNINQYKRLSKILVDARMSKELPPDILEDRNRTVLGGDCRLENVEDEVERYLHMIQNPLLNVPYWAYQPYHLEVWVEKQALQSLFREVTDRHHIPLSVGKGYPSFTFLYEGCERLKERYSINPWDGGEKPKIVVLYYGDWDPSGIDIYRYVQDMLDAFGIDPTFKRPAITLAQIERYNLPSKPAKTTDSRTNGFIAKHGDATVELDAIEPPILQGVIEDSINPFWDMSQKRERDARKQELNKELKTKLREEMVNLAEERKEE